MEEVHTLNKNRSYRTLYINFLIIPIALLAFLFSIHTMGLAFGVLGKSAAASILAITSNPFIGLFIGLLITAILQSSSTTTSMVVAAVAAGSLELSSAIPIVMGANIGTTLTSTIVSLSYITKSGEFRKAISAGTMHDIFNILVVVIIFPLQLKYQFLSQLSSYLGASVSSVSITDVVLFQGKLDFFSPVSEGIITWFGPFFTLVLSFVTLLVIVKYISTLLYNRLIGNVKKNFNDWVFKTSWKSFGWGFLLTGVVQSSSLTTSLIVPLAATGKVALNRAFQFILGANLGTTITALLAALFQSEAALSLAFAHFLLNLIGVSIFFLVPSFQKLPVYLANRLGLLMLKYRIIGFAYILITFFALPFSLIYFSSDQKIIENTKQIEASPVAKSE